MSIFLFIVYSSKGKGKGSEPYRQPILDLFFSCNKCNYNNHIWLQIYIIVYIPDPNDDDGPLDKMQGRPFTVAMNLNKKQLFSKASVAT